MITKEDIERINFLSRKSREQELSEAEKAEQLVLRRKYIDYIKSQVKVQLDSIEYVEDKHECGCGHDHKHEGHNCNCGHEHHHHHDHHHDHHHKHDKN